VGSRIRRSSPWRERQVIAISAFVLPLLIGRQVAAADAAFIFVNMDDDAVGFNDESPREPVLGDELWSRVVFERAASERILRVDLRGC